MPIAAVAILGADGAASRCSACRLRSFLARSARYLRDGRRVPMLRREPLEPEPRAGAARQASVGSVVLILGDRHPAARC